MDDREILDLFWARDERAIEMTQRAHGGKLNRLAVGILRTEEDAEECVSDTYWKAWETIPPQRPNYFFAYLAKICRFLCFGRLDWQNAQKRSADVVSLTEEMELCIPDCSRDRQLESRELGRLLTKFLDTLPKESRVIFLRRYWYAQSVREIAIGCGVSESKVKTQLHRTRNKLRGYLEKEGIAV